jgi:rSAM/selenodomain-associated transferase 1
MVIAKSPAPGRVKTRLCPPLLPDQAAELAEAALSDTLRAVGGVPRRERGRRIVVLEGPPGPWVPRGFEVVPQAGGGLDDRLAAAFEACPGPAFLVGMDTPQLTPEMLRGALTRLREVDAVLGPAEDGGYWGVGLRRPHGDAFRGIPMSTPVTFDAQLRRLRERELRVALLPTLRDVDRFDDALAVAAAAPATRFAAVVRRTVADLEGGRAVRA